MSLHLDDDDEEPSARTSELVLSTGVILGGIVGLVLLCGLFFGLGYSMHHPSPVPLPVASTTGPSTPDANFGNFKPAAGSPLHPDATSTTAAAPLTPAAPKPAFVASTSIPVATKPITPAATPLSTSVAAQSPNGFYVQIAAVSHPQDAQRLADALHARGYLVTTRTEPQDKLLHVQIGPYASRKDAYLIRQKLIGEGYTPIVK